MRELDRPIGKVFRRLRLQRFLTALVWCLAGYLFVASGVLGAKRLGYAIPGDDYLPFMIAGGAAFLTALLVAMFGGATRVDAAVAIDRAFHLNERLSSVLTLPEDLRETPAGRALIRDTVKHVESLEIGEKFGLRLPRRLWLPLVPGLIAVAIMFAPQWTAKLASARPNNSVSQKIDPKVVAKKSEALGKRISEQRKELDKNKFAEAEKLLAEIEKAAQDLSKAPPAEKDKALMALNKLTEQLKDRQKQLGAPESVNRQLRQLSQMNNSKGGPAEELMKNLAKADFQKAAQDLKQLQDKISSGKMSETEKKQLQEQLSEMSKQLEKMAGMEERKKQLDEALKNGGLTKEQHEKEMKKLEQQKQSLQDLKNLADKLNQAQQNLSKGDMQKAADALGMTQQQLEQMAQQLQEMQSLDSALADLQDAKNGMNGEGDGEGNGNQLGEGMGRFGRGSRNGNGGLGQGRGAGDRPEAPDDTAAFNTKVKQQYTKGKAVIEGTGPPSAQMKGRSLVNIQGEIETAAGAAADALSSQKVPRTFEKHIKGYFDQLNPTGGAPKADAPK